MLKNYDPEKESTPRISFVTEMRGEVIAGFLRMPGGVRIIALASGYGIQVSDIRMITPADMSRYVFEERERLERYLTEMPPKEE